MDRVLRYLMLLAGLAMLVAGVVFNMLAGKPDRISVAIVLAGIALQFTVFGLRVFWLPLERR